MTRNRTDRRTARQTDRTEKRTNRIEEGKDRRASRSGIRGRNRVEAPEGTRDRS